MIKCKSLGKDWPWGNQDGGAGNIGTVLSVEGSGQVLVCTTYFLKFWHILSFFIASLLMKLCLIKWFIREMFHC